MVLSMVLPVIFSAVLMTKMKFVKEMVDHYTKKTPYGKMMLSQSPKSTQVSQKEYNFRCQSLASHWQVIRKSFIKNKSFTCHFGDKSLPSHLQVIYKSCIENKSFTSHLNASHCQVIAKSLSSHSVVNHLQVIMM